MAKQKAPQTDLSKQEIEILVNSAAYKEFLVVCRKIMSDIATAYAEFGKAMTKLVEADPEIKTIFDKRNEKPTKPNAGKTK